MLYIDSGRVATRDNRTQSETSHLAQLRTSVYKRVNGAFFGTIRFRVPKDECLAYSKRERLRWTQGQLPQPNRGIGSGRTCYYTQLLGRWVLLRLSWSKCCRCCFGVRCYFTMHVMANIVRQRRFFNFQQFILIKAWKINVTSSTG